MTLTDYILNRIAALKTADTTQHDGIWREETPEQRASRVNELENLLAVMSSTGLKGLGGAFPDLPWTEDDARAFAAHGEDD